jgi:hypothetical protein
MFALAPALDDQLVEILRVVKMLRDAVINTRTSGLLCGGQS